MAVSVREVVSANASGSWATTTTGAGTVAGDLLVCFYGCDFYLLSDMGNISGTAGTWKLETTADAGSNLPHVKVLTRRVTVAGAQTVTVPQVSDAEVYNFTYVIQNGAVDVAAGNASSTATTSPVAPSLTTVDPIELLLCAWQIFAQVNFTAPSGMTNMLESDNAFATMGSARQDLTTAGSTGTKTATITTSQSYAAASIAVKTAFPFPGAIAGLPAALTRAALW